MNTYGKKVAIIALMGLMTFSMIVGSEFDTYALEQSSIEENLLVNSTISENIFSSYDNLTIEEKELYNRAMEEEISKHKGEAGFNEEQFKKEVSSFVFNNESKLLKEKDTYRRARRWKYTGIWLSNSVVASGINVAICLVTGGVGTVGIKMLVKKVGTKAAVKVIEKAIKNKLIWFGLKQVTGITPIINSIVKNLLDPGTAIAKWYDSRDKRPNNGRCDIA